MYGRRASGESKDTTSREETHLPPGSYNKTMKKRKKGKVTTGGRPMQQHQAGSLSTVAFESKQDVPASGQRISPSPGLCERRPAGTGRPSKDAEREDEECSALSRDNKLGCRVWRFFNVSDTDS